MESLFEERIKKVRTEMEKKKFSGLLISDPQSIWYLTGIWNNPYERLYALYLEKDGNIKLFVNRLFNVPENDLENIWYSDTDDAAKIVAENITHSGVIGVDKIFPARFLIPLMIGAKGARFSVGSSCVDDVRACKDSHEQQLMKDASRINDICIQKAFDFVREGVTEKEVAEYIGRCFRAEGAEGESFDTIVSFGANAADPHHESDNTVIKAGDCVLIDMGCRKNGYCSDMTRTNFFKSADEEYIKIHDLVRQANEKAESMIGPGVKFSDIDAAARDVIKEAGFGEYFTHRLGHFIGQSEHEAGDVSSSNNGYTKEGMIFSIEPGVYLPGKFGVRIEDLVLVTAGGCQRLNLVDKHFRILGRE